MGSDRAGVSIRTRNCGCCLSGLIWTLLSQQCKVCSQAGKSCGPTGPPDGPGVEDADFVLYVSGLTTERCGQENIVAYAAYCQLEAELDRWVGLDRCAHQLKASTLQNCVGLDTCDGKCARLTVCVCVCVCVCARAPPRPIAGYANLCPAMISSQPQEFEGMLSTVKHEIIHALVSLPSSLVPSCILRSALAATVQLPAVSTRAFPPASLPSITTMRADL